MIKDQFKKNGQSIDLNGQTISINITTSPFGIPLPRMRVNQLTFSVVVQKHTSSGSTSAYFRGYRGSSVVINETMRIYFSQSGTRTASITVSGGTIIDGLYLASMGRARPSKVSITFDDVEMVDE